MTEFIKPDRPVVSLHFPKAGGSSFFSQLAAAFGRDNVLSSYECDPVDPDNVFSLHRDWFLNHRPADIGSHKVVHGHFPIVRYDLLEPAWRTVILRAPVDNIISIYFYWQSLFEKSVSGHAVFEFVKREKLSLLETAEIPALRWLMSRTYFGGYNMRRFDLIGTHENRSNFVARFSSLIGRDLAPAAPENVTPVSEARGNAMSDATVLARLRLLLQDDIRFYESHT